MSPIQDLPPTVTLRDTFGRVWTVARDAVVGFVSYPGRLTFVETATGEIGEVVSAASQ